MLMACTGKGGGYFNVLQGGLSPPSIPAAVPLLPCVAAAAVDVEVMTMIARRTSSPARAQVPATRMLHTRRCGGQLQQRVKPR